MSGAALWIALAVLIAGAAFALRWAAVLVSRKTPRRAWLTLECPATSQAAAVIAAQDEMSGQYTDIVRCSELECSVKCARGCLVQIHSSSKAC